jgi:uncharacterized protein with PIN domain
MACNGIIKKIEKQEVLARLQPQTIEYFDEFYQCQHCHRIYWKGSHYEKMLKFIQHLY